MIEAPANAAAFIERPLPAAARAVCCTLDQQTDRGATWGPGVSLVWANGKTLRVNLRCDGNFGVDDGPRQILEGNDLDASWITLAIQLDDDAIRVLATDDGRHWLKIAEFPRREFPGDRRPCGWAR